MIMIPFSVGPMDLISSTFYCGGVHAAFFTMDNETYKRQASGGSLCAEGLDLVNV